MIERLPSIDKLFSTVVFVVILPNVDLTLSAHIIIYYIVVIHTYKQKESLGECSTASICHCDKNNLKIEFYFIAILAIFQYITHQFIKLCDHLIFVLVEIMNIYI